VKTDLFVNPRNPNKFFEDLMEDIITGTCGDVFCGQRSVPSLGGGPGYCAPADEIWSVGEEILEQVRADGVDLPTIDSGLLTARKHEKGCIMTPS
jgi:hypothetical protein